VYVAAARDVCAQEETGYYQVPLDYALVDVARDNVENLRQVLNVVQVAYAANQVTQTDVVNAEFQLTAAQRTQRQLELNRLNDKTTLNQLLHRRPDEPLQLTVELKLVGIETLSTS
jgi:outer membrane protein TolC